MGQVAPPPRANRAMRNAVFAVGSYAVLMVSVFITRKIFVSELGLGILGIEQAFKNIISMLSLAELGIGTGLIYLLYHPIVENDRTTIRRILNFYRNAYRVTASVIGGAGLILCFFASRFFKETADSPLVSPFMMGVYFLLFTVDTLAAYLFANHRALIIADQRGYINNINEVVMNVAAVILQAACLLLFGNFLLYIVIKIVCRLLSAWLIRRSFYKYYPDIAADRNPASLTKEERGTVLKNIRAMLFHKVGGFGITASGNIIISSQLGDVANGIYGNYTLLVVTFNQLVAQVFAGITASFGHFLDTGKKEAVKERFNVLYHVNFLLAAFFTCLLTVTLRLVVQTIGGDESLLPSNIGLVFVAYFYVSAMRRVIQMALDSRGLFMPDRYMPLLEFAINVAVSFALVNTDLGVGGIIIGGLVSVVLVPFWVQPVIVYRNILEVSCRRYFVRYFLYAAAAAAGCALTLWVDARLPDLPFIPALAAKGVLCLIIPNGINLLLFCKTKEAAEVHRLVRHIWTVAAQMLRQTVRRRCAR